MSILTKESRVVNTEADQGCPDTCYRRYEQLRRVMGLVDLLAPAMRPQSTHEIQHAYNDRFGTTWHWRTIRRDLAFLEESGLVDMELRHDFADSRTATACWKLNLQRSETAQETAMAVVDSHAALAMIPADELQTGWDVFIIDTQTGEVWQVWTGLTKAEVLSRWKLWKERKTQCVLVAWPQWLPHATITMTDRERATSEPT